MESKQILLINDLPGYGKVALAAMMPLPRGLLYLKSRLS